MSEHVELPIELAHCDRFGVHHECMYGGKGEPVGGQFALDGCQRVTEGFITLETKENNGITNDE